MAHISMAGSCMHGILASIRCFDCWPLGPADSAYGTSRLPAPPSGWLCPGCGHSYAPWVPECHHCPEPPAFIAKGNAE